MFSINALSITWVDRNRTYEAAEIDLMINRAVGIFKRNSLNADSKIGLFAKPGIDYVVSLCAVLQMQAVPVLIDLGLGNQLGNILTQVQVSALVYTHDHFDEVELSRDVENVIYFCMDGEQKGALSWPEQLNLNLDFSATEEITSDICKLMFFESDSVGVDHELSNITNQSLKFCQNYFITASDVILSARTMCCEESIVMGIFAGIITGARVCLVASWLTKSIYEVIDLNFISIVILQIEQAIELASKIKETDLVPANLRLVIISGQSSESVVADLLERKLEVGFYLEERNV